MHHKNIQAFATEMFKVKYDLCPEIACNIFIEGTNCRLKSALQKDLPKKFKSIAELFAEDTSLLTIVKGKN